MIYKDEHLKEIIFPIGGIGSGSIGLRGNGQLIDWEIFNRPAKGTLNYHSHMAIKLTIKDKTYIKILNTDLQKDLMGQYSKRVMGGYGFGPDIYTMQGFPHFRDSEFNGEFPIAEISFSDKDFPGRVVLKAFNPFIPLDYKNSSLPAAFFDISYENETDEDVTFESFFVLANPFKATLNKASKSGNISSVTLYHAGKTEDELEYGDITLSTIDADRVQEYWYRGGWQDGILTYWNEINADGLTKRTFDTPHEKDHCAISKKSKLQKNDKASHKYVISWNIPNCSNHWCLTEDKSDRMWKNYYATVFENSIKSGHYCIENFENLYEKTLDFKNELFSSTVDDVIIDAISSTMSVIKTPTVKRLENGEFYGFEGLHQQVGSCEGSCQHVWNYAYALCFMFPELERSMRDLEFKYTLKEDGGSIFRLALPLGDFHEFQKPCLDGQMGTVMKIYREWKISGNTKWLKDNWKNVKKLISFAWSDLNEDEWDRNKDGVLEGRQHHTLDMELFGPSSWLQGFYLGALKAGAEMAEYLGYYDDAKEFTEIYNKGYKWTKENLFNGEYFIQKVDLNDSTIPKHFGCEDVYWNSERNEIKYQIGEGSEIDQLCGQWHCSINGLGYIFDKEQITTALKSMLKYNFKETLRNYPNPFRLYGINDESGSVICEYPEHINKPFIPIPYCNECMHGFEYQFAGLLMSEGFIDEGIKIVKSIRDRYNGENRNPFNEMECGSNYARSMASFAILPILSGFIFDLPNEKIGFNPKVNKDNFKVFWSLGTGWGNVEINKTTKINIKYGSLTLSKVELPYLDNVNKIIIDGKEADFTFEDKTVNFKATEIKKFIEIL